MRTFDPWDVIKVPFPYTNRPAPQRRPALVVSMQEASGYPRLLWVLMITSAQNRGWPGDVTIPDPAAAGLPAPSIVRTAKIATIEAEDAECIGRLQRNEQLQVALSLRDKLDSILAASN